MAPTVIDFFCGAGGFSEGFRQQGFKIISGYDYWQPAVDTFNFNFGLDNSAFDILSLEFDDDAIENLPDSDVILGSPPCVSFSSSNKSGKAEKKDGIRLTKIFLRIVAIKKHSSNSILKAWFMENVKNSRNYLQGYYSFRDLNLSGWAKKNKFSIDAPAIVLEGNHALIDSSVYGSAQKRKRVISGEIVKSNKLVIPTETHGDNCLFNNKSNYKNLGELLSLLPRPNHEIDGSIIVDPNYKNIKIQDSELTDHYYDTGLYECVWRQSRYLKVNHPYMGKMSFPEDLNRPARTVTATKIGSSREAHIYLSEYNRIGDGQYRTPTIREMASIMGFPVTYQFVGSEGMKSRLIGNAVCPSVSRAFAITVRDQLGLRKRNIPFVRKKVKVKGYTNLNDFTEKSFPSPPKRNVNSRFRRHICKDGNITITLSNYDIELNEKEISNWRLSVQYGNGRGFPCHNIISVPSKSIKKLISKDLGGRIFIKKLKKEILPKVGCQAECQAMYERQKSIGGMLEPTILIDLLKEMIERHISGKTEVCGELVSSVFPNKNAGPLIQFYALYALNCVVHKINKEIAVSA